MTNFKIEIVSDTVCPWCYVGHKKISKAIADYKSEHPDATFDITWKPYQLNPAAPAPGIDKSEMYSSKFGAERANMIFARLASVGKSVGIDFKFGGKTGNTRDSHRLIEFARTKGKQNEVVEQLFEAYFENDEDISTQDVLLQRAKKAGLDEAEVKTMLRTDGFGDEVDHEVRAAQKKGVNSVPTFFIQNQYVLGGAQDPDEFVEIFENIAEKQQ